MLTSFRTFFPASPAVEDLSGSTDKSLKLTMIIIWSLIGIGIALRLYHFIDNRSLWNDEIYLATSLIRMNFLELATGPLDYQQKAPIGFLWLVRLSVLLFGKAEMALRLVPLLSGIASLLFFMPVSRYFLKPLGAMLAMGILALAPALIYHAVEIKQYSTELLATMVSLYLYTRYSNRFNLSSLLLWGIWGAIIFWFSFTAVFVLGGIATGLVLFYLLQKDWHRLFYSSIPFSLWLLSFGLVFYLFISEQTDANWLVEWFRKRGGFLPHNASVAEVGRWLFQALYAFLKYPMSVLWNAYQIQSVRQPVLRFFLQMAPLFFLCWTMGYVSYFRSDKKDFLVLLLPFVLTIIAATLEKYPLFDRLLVFLAPIPLILIAQGCQQLTYSLPAVVGRLRYVLPVLLLLWPLYRSSMQMINTDMFADTKKSYYREGFLYIKEHMQKGDQVYVYWNIEHVYNYYNEVCQLQLGANQLPDLRSKSKNATEYMNQLKPYYSDAVGSSRVWFVTDPFMDMQIGDYEHQYPWYKEDEQVKSGRLLYKHFNLMGKEVDSFHKIDLEVSLFDLSQ
jgi:4-amino-4-deoxy-L-arabinose transferase-like glycosyltransferase